jgi:hypothetical protein
LILLLLIGFGFVASIQLPGLIKKQWWKELVCFSALWIAGLILSLMIAAGITLPPITTIINSAIVNMCGM